MLLVTRFRKCIITCCVVLCHLVNSHAQPEFTIINYNSKKGLPQNSVKSIMQDFNGFIWLTTEGGLVRFDGRTFKVYNKGNTPFIRNDRFTNLLKTVDSNLVAFDGLGGVYLIDHKTSSLSDHSEYKFNDMRFVHGGLMNLWQAQHLSWKQSLRDTNWLYREEVLVMPLNTDEFVLRNNQGLLFFKNNKVTGFFKTKGYNYTRYFVINGNLYLLDDSFNLLRLNSNRNGFVKCLKDFDFINPAVRWTFGMEGVYFTDQNALYELISDSTGVRFTKKLVCNNLPENVVLNSVYYDRNDHVLYLGTSSKGLFVYKQREFKTIGDKLNKSATGTAYYTQFPVNDSTVFTSNGTVPENAQLNKVFEHVRLDYYASYLDSNNNYWYCTLSKLNRYSLVSKSNAKTYPLDYGEVVTSFLPSGDSLWIGTSKRIAYLYKDSIYTFCNVPPPSIDKWIYKMVPKGNKLWFNNCTGVFSIDIKTKEVDTVKALFGQCVRSLDLFNDIFFAGTYGNGFYLFNEDRFVKIPLDKEMYLSYVHAFIPDSNNDIWITTNMGLFRTNMQNLLGYFNGTQQDVMYDYFSEEDGIKNIEFNGGCWPTHVRLKNGKVSLPTMEGLVQFIPEKVSEAFTGYPVIIDKVFFNDTISVRNDFKKVPAKINSIQINFSSAYYGNAYNHDFEYQLKPIMDNFRPVSGNMQQLVFHKLSPGNYSLEIRKRAGTKRADNIGTIIQFEVEPRYYQTVWFFLICLVVGFVIIIISARLYALNVRLRNRELEMKVLQRTGELLSANEQLEQNISVKNKLISIITHDVVTPLRFIAMVARKGSNDKSVDPEIIKESLEDIKHTSERLHDNAQNILNWIKYQNKRITVVRSNVAVNAVVEELSELMSDIAATENTTIINDISPDDVIKTDKNILTIILQNLLSNALKFTSNGSIIFTSKYEGDYYSITVRDTGQGMTESQLGRIKQIIHSKSIAENVGSSYSSGYGLGYIIICELLLILPGSIEIESVAGVGTTVSITIKVME